MIMPELEKKWRRIAERHSVAVERFLSVGSELSDGQWRAPIEDGDWTPMQITQHLIQTYQVLTRQLRTGRGLTVQTGWLLRQVLRLLALPPIMLFRWLPSGVKTARDLLPVVTPIDRDTALMRLREAAAEFEAELLARRGQERVVLTHHIFGSVNALNALDFVAVHTEHHGRQLSRLMTRRRVKGGAGQVN